MTLRVRFAPSPTGYLHVGGARTALFNWLEARRTGGVFLLRIEDTDRERSSEAHTAAILDGMRWLGLDWDEGPVFQSEGVARHRADALRLLEEGRAYRDFTPPEALAQLRVEAPDRVLRFPREQAWALGSEAAEAKAAAGEPHAIRFLVPEGETVWEDRVHGTLRFRNEDIEDLVLLRSDGTPTYNLAVVSDDVEGRINLVMRGDDHVSNTPKQILLFEALGHPVPAFAHLPMILGPDGKRLSKRHGATAVGEYRGEGILPEAMVNFLALLGWNPGTEEEVFSRAALIEAFSLERVQKKSAVFDPTRLAWLNGRHLADAPGGWLADEVRSFLGDLPDSARGQLEAESGAWFQRLLGLLKVRCRTVAEVAEQARSYLTDPVSVDPEAAAKHWWADVDTARGHLEALEAALATAPAFDEETLEAVVRGVAEARGVGAGRVIHPLRVALTGQQASPGIFEVLALLGPHRALGRIREALLALRTLPSSGSGAA
jgi:glutamyl-tRNA synthetase